MQCIMSCLLKYGGVCVCVVIWLGCFVAQVSLTLYHLALLLECRSDFAGPPIQQEIRPLKQVILIKHYLWALRYLVHNVGV